MGKRGCASELKFRIENGWARATNRAAKLRALGHVGNHSLWNQKQMARV